MKKHWGFDIRDIDKQTRPQDDFYQYANGGWFKKNKIPHDESRWGTFLILRKKTDEQLRALIERARDKQIHGLYRSAMDMKLRNKLDAKPLKPWLDKIAAVSTHDELVMLIAELHRLGIGVAWGAGVDQDEKQTDKNIMHLGQGGLGLPDRDYYLGEHPEQVRVRDAYRTHVERMFGLIGESKADAIRKADMVIAFETVLAKASMKKEEMRDPHKVYHKMTLAKLQKTAPHISWHTYFRLLGANKPFALNVHQPEFIRITSAHLKETSLEVWRAYLAWHLVTETAAHLSNRFVQADFDFYGRVLTGAKKMKPEWRRALAIVNASLGEAVGKLYVTKHFPPEAKKKIDELVSDIFAVYEERLKKLDWMSPATKKKALKKLHTMTRKIGYPKRWKSYKGLVIKPNDYFGNVLRSALYEHRRNLKKLGKKVDRDEWHMTPQMVNAYYNPTTNTIAFPAAILQPPYFSSLQDDALNYGAIGGVIGHEMTHGFDDEGSQFDAHGDLKSWWTTEDRKRFERKAKVLEKQFNAYALHGVKVNGKLTLGENIADLGGYAIALDAYHRHLAKVGHTVIDGLTPLQRFFFGMALDWRTLSRPEFQKTMMLIDPHSPEIFRTNGPVSNLPEFYEAFGVKKGDKLYRAPKERAKIW